MDAPETAAPPQEKKNDKLVTITVDNQPKQIEKGPYDLADFKTRVGIDASKDVDQLVDGTFVQLDPDKKVHIKGAEVFLSHVPQGGSS
jgi:hypothetical protein